MPWERLDHYYYYYYYYYYEYYYYYYWMGGSFPAVGMFRYQAMVESVTIAGPDGMTSVEEIVWEITQ